MSRARHRFAQRFPRSAEQRLEEIRQILRDAEPMHAPSTRERLDAEAIEDRHVFKRRFGCDWSLRTHRESLVSLLRERDWTDREVRLFLLSGLLQHGPFGVRAAPSALIATVGVVLMASMLVFAVVTAALLIERAQSMDADHIASGGGVVLLFLGITWLAYRLYVRPWRLLRGSDAQA
jgi:hypothetical protein